jgi:2-furoate---CoA ligase
MNIGRVFHLTARRYPEATALVDREAGIRYSYQNWYDRSVEVASALQAHGIGEGDSVATAMRNRAETSTLYCATQLLGAVFIPYKFRLSANELTYLVNNTDPDILFFSDEVADVIDAPVNQADRDPDLVAVDSEHSDAMLYDTFVDRGNPGEFTPTFVSRDSTSIVLHTSGTTGKPKGLPRTHDNTYTAGMAHAIQHGWTQKESTLGMMSLSHTMGIHSLTALFLLSGKWVIQRRFSAEAILDLIESEQLTSLYLIPTVFHDLFRSKAVETTDFSSVRHISFAGSRISPSTVKAVEKHVNPETFVNHYGSTELYTHAVCDSANEKLNCLGRAGINTAVRVVEPNDFGQLDPTATVEPEKVGELIVNASSPEASDGYLSDTRGRALADGWFFTGDLGYRDENGDLFIVGRVDDMIISGGENIYPVEVEQVIETHDVVDEIAVVGRPSERWNQMVAAFVTLTIDPSNVDFGTAADALDEHCRRSSELANFKRPRKYFFIGQFNKNYVGKVLRKELQKRDLDIDVYAEVDV